MYHHERITGVFNYDTGPLDHRYYDAFKEFKEYIQKLRELNLSSSNSKDIAHYLKENIKDPKWRSVF